MSTVCKGNHTCDFKGYSNNAIIKKNIENPNCNMKEQKLYIQYKCEKSADEMLKHRKIALYAVITFIIISNLFILQMDSFIKTIDLDSKKWDS